MDEALQSYIEHTQKAVSDLQKWVKEQEAEFLKANPGAIVLSTEIEKIDGQYHIVFNGLKPRTESNE